MVHFTSFIHPILTSCLTWEFDKNDRCKFPRQERLTARSATPTPDTRYPNTRSLRNLPTLKVTEIDLDFSLSLEIVSSTLRIYWIFKVIEDVFHAILGIDLIRLLFSFSNIHTHMRIFRFTHLFYKFIFYNNITGRRRYDAK